MKRILCFALLALIVAGCAGAPTAPAPVPAPVPTTPASVPTQPASTGSSAPTAPGAQAPVPVSPAPQAVTLKPPVVSNFGGLTVQTYELGPDLGEEHYMAIASKRPGWLETAGPQTEADNRLLAPFGYHLTVKVEDERTHPIYTLSQGEKVLVSRMEAIASLTVNAGGDDFALLADTGRGYTLFQKGRAEPWQNEQHEFVAPVYLGNDLMMVKKKDEPNPTFPFKVDFSVLRGNNAVYSMKFTYDRTDNPVKSLQVWQNHWILEAAGDVIIDGQSQKTQQQVDEIFNWRPLAGKPFYLINKGGQYTAVYDGKPLPGGPYQDVVHYRCCSPGMFNAGGNGPMAWFFGKRAGQWYYVELKQGQ